MTNPTPDIGHARPRPELDRGNSPRKQRSVTRRFTRGLLLAFLPATSAVALTGALGAAGAQAEPHPDRRPTDVSLAGVSTAFAAERAACTTEKAGKGCFYPHGDHILVQDLKSDGARVSVQWVTSYGRRGTCRRGHCNYNMRENERIQFRLVVRGGSRVTRFPWVGPVPTT
jgi:hypothetical protein